MGVQRRETRCGCDDLMARHAQPGAWRGACGGRGPGGAAGHDLSGGGHNAPTQTGGPELAQ
eukprot:356013-Chlamydomonas_euryale.AAC.4